MPVAHVRPWRSHLSAATMTCASWNDDSGSSCMSHAQGPLHCTQPIGADWWTPDNSNPSQVHLPERRLDKDTA